MATATCSFCGRKDFRNRQAVRAHLRYCPAYRQAPKATLPYTGKVPKASALGRPFNSPRPGPRRTTGSNRTSRPIPRLARHEAQEVDEQELANQELDAQEAERQQRAREQQEVAHQREHEREAVRRRAQQEAAARERREAAEREVKERRRRIIQRIKHVVIRERRPVAYTIPSETEALALTAIERELSRLPLEDLPESELVTIAEGIRDPLYQPVIRAQHRALEEEERKQKQVQRRTDLIDSGASYASRELLREHDLDGLALLNIVQKVKRALEQEIDGSEAEAEIRALADEILDHELEAFAAKRREEARPELIDHGVAYAAHELAQEKELDSRTRWKIEDTVKQELEEEITGDESERDVKALVDEILDKELPETEGDDGF
jgi:hypothetical protein